MSNMIPRWKEHLSVTLEHQDGDLDMEVTKRHVRVHHVHHVSVGERVWTRKEIEEDTSTITTITNIYTTEVLIQFRMAKKVLVCVVISCDGDLWLHNHIVKQTFYRLVLLVRVSFQSFVTLMHYKQCRVVSSSWISLYSHRSMIKSLFINIITYQRI